MHGKLYQPGMLDESVLRGVLVNQKEFNQAMSENMDLSDMPTLNAICSIHEEDRAALLTSLTSKLYDNIVDKVDKIDFGTIATSRGDITKIENYEKLLECIELMRNIIKEYHQDTAPIDEVSDAVANVRDRTKLWTKCYAMNLELPIITYQTIVMAIVASISLLITTSIEYIKNSEDDTFDISLDRVAYNKTKNNLLYNDLKKFNAACKAGQIDAMIENVISTNSKQFAGTVVNAFAAGTAIILILKMIVPMLRELVFFFFHAGQSISDYFAVQADLLEVNANNIQYKSNIPDEDKVKIYGRQTGIADRFRKISNTFAVKMNKAEKNAEKDISLAKKKYKIDELQPDTGDSDDSYGLF